MRLHSQVEPVTPSPPWKLSRSRKFLSIWLILALGSGLTFLRFSYLRAHDQEVITHEFELRANNYVLSFSREMSGLLSVLHSVGSFAGLQPDLNRNTFETYSAREVKSHPEIVALEWLPHVLKEERAAYEQKLSAMEGRPAGITFGTSADPKPSPEKPDYFPITLMYPRTAAANVIGFNGYSQKEVHAALDKARDSGEIVSTAKFHLVEYAPDGFAVPFYVPVYGGAKLTGYVLGIVRISSVLEEAMKQISDADVNVAFYDLSAARGKQLLYFHRAPGEAASVQASPVDLALVQAPMKLVRQFPMAKRQWAIVCTPTVHYLQGVYSWRHFGLLLIGLLGTASFCTYLLLHISYTARAEALVGQLFQKNIRLNQEIEERKKAEQEISRLNSSLEERVTERTEALRESEQRYALAALGSKDGLWDWNLTQGTIYFSQRWKNMLGYGEDEISTAPEEWFKRMHPDDERRVRSQIQAHFTSDTSHFQSEHRMLHKDGTYRWMLSRGVAVRDDRGRATRVAGSQTDITEDRVADPLTGLPNRLFLAEKLQQAIQKARDSRSHLFAVLFLDLDRFKIVNDSLGHKAGDLLLKSIAGRLQSCCQPAKDAAGGAVIARLGGDEFAVLLDEVATPSVATNFAAAIKSAMNPAFDLEGRQVFATCSIGVALGGPDTDAGDILRDADIAMYQAKSQGRHRYELFDAAMRQRAVDRMQLETDLRAAIPRNELDIHYQPKISLEDGSLIEFEALVRWNHPVRGFLMPSSFVPLADETGIILSIGKWVMFQACRQLAKWRQQFGRNIGISVNISARQFETADLVSQVRYILDDTRLPPSCLSLEVTESLLLENPESAIRQLNELRAIGIGLKIDDFGTGFSSLSYLHRLPFNELKIDRSFISTFGKKPEAAHIVHTIILLAGLLDMKVVAEGVETEEQLELLTALGCNYAQGNFFAAPLDFKAAETFLDPKCRPFFRHEGGTGVQLVRVAQLHARF